MIRENLSRLCGSRRACNFAGMEEPGILAVAGYKVTFTIAACPNVNGDDVGRDQKEKIGATERESGWLVGVVEKGETRERVNGNVPLRSGGRESRRRDEGEREMALGEGGGRGWWK